MAWLAHGKQQNRNCTLVQFLGNFNFFRRIRNILSTLLNEKLKHRFPCAGVYLSLFLGLSLWRLKACPGVLGSNQHQALIVSLWSRCQCWGASCLLGALSLPHLQVHGLLARALLCLAASVFLRSH